MRKLPCQNDVYAQHVLNAFLVNVARVTVSQMFFLRFSILLRLVFSSLKPHEYCSLLFDYRKVFAYCVKFNRRSARSVFALLLVSASTISIADTGDELDRAYGYATAGNYGDAIAIWKILAKSGEPNSLYNLSIVYEKGIVVEKDIEKSFALCEQAAINGQVPAQAHLGTKYRLGIGVGRDLEEAIMWYQRAAAQGDMAALSSLGNIYVSEEGGNDYVKAHDYWSAAAALGDVNSIFNLAILFHRGAGEYKADIQQAIELYTAAATAGSIEAMANLIGIYSAGDGVPIDLREAYFWCDIAVAAGLEENRSYLKYLKSQLTTEELRLAKEEILNWQELRRSYTDYGKI